jgi:hypothetical protein
MLESPPDVIMLLPNAIKHSYRLALDLRECDYSTFYLGKFSTWLLSLFCLFCIKIRPKETTKTNSKYTTFPRFITSLLSWVLGLTRPMSLISQKLNIDCYKVDSDSYLSLPTETVLIDWHRDSAFTLATENIKLKTGLHTYKFFVYLNPNPFSFMREGSSTLEGGKKSTQGALSFIPSSSRFSRAVDSAIFHNFIPFDGDHSLAYLVSRVRDILDEMEKRNLQSFFGLERKEYIKFIDTANNVLSSGPGLSSFFTTFLVDPGKVVVFNARATHRGGATVDSQRLVLRFIATGMRLEDTLFNVA